MSGPTGTHPYQSALVLREAIRTRQLSPVELMQATLERAERLQPVLNSFVTLLPEKALASARRAEAAVMAGEPLGALHGLPISVKDLIAVRNAPLTFGSRTAAATLATEDAPSVERIERAGACIMGKTTTSEFGSKAVGDSPLTGITRNPWNVSMTPGGSSAGAAASVAAGITPFAIGTDGGGSIRIPCAFTGLFGVKPQFGRVPIHPVSATPTLAHVGPMARTVRDAALLLSVISGYDARDPHALAEPVPDFLGACESPVRTLRIAWSPTLGYARPDPEVLALVQNAVKVFASFSGPVEQVENVLPEDPAALWAAEFYTGIGARLKTELAEHRPLLDPALADLLDTMKGRTATSYYGDVFRRYRLRDRLRRFFEKFDLLLTPTLPVAAFEVGHDQPPGSTGHDVVSWARYTYPFNLTGHPAASVPVGFTREGLPVGLQLVAARGCETHLFSAAAAYEAIRPWAGQVPMP